MSILPNMVYSYNAILKLPMALFTELEKYPKISMKTEKKLE